MTLAIEQPAPPRFVLLARDIKISHTVFAMPWAILSAVLAWHRTGGAIVGKLALIVVCMVTARTAAMVSNRLLDEKLDRLNPRTAGRALPSGRLSRGFMLVVLAGSTILFFAACAMFQMVYANIWPLALAIPVLAFICSYPLLKRFTRLCHYYLGAALALAPICAWIAITPAIGWPPFLMAAAVLLWTAGFDIIYACQDYQSDLETGVVSVPAKVGIGRALWIARITHAISLSFLIALGLIAPELATLYFIGVALAAGLLVAEHSIVKADDLSKVGLAFFTINGIISLAVGALGVVDVLIS